MKEIIEEGMLFLVSENYPSQPYVKYMKVAPVEPAPKIDLLAEIKTKLDHIIAEVAAVKEQTKKT